MANGKAGILALQGIKPAVKNSEDLQRILKLPRRPPLEPGTIEAEAMIEYVTAKYSKNIPSGQCNCARIFSQWKVISKPCITRLNYAQAWMLHELRVNQGLVAHAATGIGKTVVDILAAMALPDCKKAVLLVPPTLCEQLAREWELVREHFNVPTIYIHHKVNKEREWKRIIPGTPWLHVLPYSRLSLKESSVYLEKVLQPDAIFADECQNIAHLDSVRTGRLARYLEGAYETTRMGAWSGSLSDDEIEDYGTLALWALKMGSPLPLDREVLGEWGGAINPNDWQAPAGALRALCREDEELEEGYNRRLRETPGFVITSGASVDIPLEVRERPVREIPDVPLRDDRAPGMKGLIEPGWWPGVATALAHAREKWVRPDGEILLDALSASRCARELACGLFLKWKFYKGESRELVDEWKEKRKAWRSDVREMLKKKIPHMDSPLLCALAAMRAHGHLPKKRSGPIQVDIDEEGNAVTVQAGSDDDDAPEWDCPSWPDWYEIRKKVQPVTEAVRLDPFLAQDAADWATENKGIVWYQTVAFGKWVAELGKFNMHGGGPNAGKLLSKERGERSIVCSIKSHGTGRDGLQRLYATQLIAQSPASAVAYEQLFGRLSRIGQEADLVTAVVYRHTDEIRKQLDSAVKKSLYVQKTLRTPQRLTTSWME